MMAGNLSTVSLLTGVFLPLILGGCSDSDDLKSTFPRAEAVQIAGADCINNSAGGYPCRNVDMPGGLAFTVGGTDIWGWVDAVNGDEYAILGLTTGTAFIRITDPAAPVFIGFLPSTAAVSAARDVKVINDHALIVSETAAHGLQIFDLAVLAGLTEKTRLTADTRYTRFGNAHNIAVNPDSGFAYAVGSNTCNGGLHMIDMSEPKTPVFAGCYAGDGYTHDAQCVIYNGPDVNYAGREICFASNEDTLTIVDVTDKTAPQLVARKTYSGVGYTHQGWLSEDHAYFFLDDEFDEIRRGHNTRMYIWDLKDLTEPEQTFTYTATARATDHNLYVLQDHIYQANYLAGVRILRSGNLALGEVTEVAYFDTVPGIDGFDFAGAWSVFPYLGSGNIVTANTDGRFFVLRPQLDAVPRCSDGLDNDADGFTDFPADSSCSSSAGLFEG
jgi:choice-of-anchor B domain-containing protein